MQESTEEIMARVRNLVALPTAKLRHNAWQEKIGGVPFFAVASLWCKVKAEEDKAEAAGFSRTPAKCQAYVDHLTKKFGVEPTPHYLAGGIVVWAWKTSHGAKKVGFMQAPATPGLDVCAGLFRQLSGAEIDQAELPTKKDGKTLEQKVAESGNKEDVRMAKDMAAFDFHGAPPKFCKCGQEIPGSGGDWCIDCIDKQEPAKCAACGQGDRMGDHLKDHNGFPVHESCAPEDDEGNVSCQACTDYGNETGAPAEVFHAAPMCAPGKSMAEARAKEDLALGEFREGDQAHGDTGGPTIDDSCGEAESKPEEKPAPEPKVNKTPQHPGEEGRGKEPTYARVLFAEGEVLPFDSLVAFCCICGFSVPVAEKAWKHSAAGTDFWAHDKCVAYELVRMGQELTGASEAGFEIRRQEREEDAGKRCHCGCSRVRHSSANHACTQCACKRWRPCEGDPEPLVTAGMEKEAADKEALAWAMGADVKSPSKQRKTKAPQICLLCTREVTQGQQYVKNTGKPKKRAHLECTVNLVALQNEEART